MISHLKPIEVPSGSKIEVPLVTKIEVPSRTKIEVPPGTRVWLIWEQDIDGSFANKSMVPPETIVRRFLQGREYGSFVDERQNVSLGTKLWFNRGQRI